MNSNIHLRKISLSAYFKAVSHYFGFNGPTRCRKSIELQSSPKLSVGKVAFFTSSFPSFPAPGPMLIKTLMFVCVVVLFYPNIEYGGRGIFSKRENSLFSGLKWTTVKLYNLPNYFCLWLKLHWIWWRIRRSTEAHTRKKWYEVRPV